MKKLNPKNIDKLKSLVESSSAIVIATHLNADGDAIGSSLGLGLILQKLGKKVNIITPNEYPEFLKWMTGTDMIRIYDNEISLCIELTREADLIFAVDFNDPRRLRSASVLLSEDSTTKVLIDHHPDPVKFADIMFSEVKLGSSSELVYYIIRELGYSGLIDKPVAEALFTGIMTDTGCFNYSCSYPDVWEVVADLMRQGINRDEIYRNIYASYSENRTRLMGYCLNEKMIIIKEFNTAYISLDASELCKFRHEAGDTEGFVNLPFSIHGIRLTALFTEQDDHVKISFRSRGGFSVHEFASKHFRGGGHLNAAGAEWDLPLENAIRRFREILPLYAESLK